MVRDKLYCGELIKRLNDILGTCANKELKSDDMTASQIKMLIIISETKNESITLKELEKHCKHAWANMVKKEEWFLSSLDDDEKEELWRLLQKIYDNMRRNEV